MAAIGHTHAKLLPCPFCGSEAVQENYVIEAVVRCKGSWCGASIKRKHAPREDTGIELSRKAWNERVA